MVSLTSIGVLQWGSPAACRPRQHPQMSSSHHTQYPTDCCGRLQLDLHKKKFHLPDEQQVLRSNENSLCSFQSTRCSLISRSLVSVPQVVETCEETHLGNKSLEKNWPKNIYLKFLD